MKKFKGKCNNCKKEGHKAEDCYGPGGVKEGQAPWQLKKKQQEEKEKKSNSANVANKGEATESVALCAYTPSEHDNNPHVALACTSTFQEEAEALAAIGGTYSTIIDCGANHHYSPDREKFKDFVEIAPEPIWTANGSICYATGKGNLETVLPMGKDQPPTKVTLTNTYYSKDMAFTLVSVSHLDKKGMSVTMEDGECTI